jgi:hypothetical protein
MSYAKRYMTIKVLKSGTEHAEPLTVNIRSSHRGMVKDREMEKRLAALEKVAHPPKSSKIIRIDDDEEQREDILKKRA